MAQDGVMPRVWTRAEVFEAVRKELVDALGIDKEDVAEESVLSTDLGAESIDFLDIEFRLKRIFEVGFKDGELFPRPKDFGFTDGRWKDVGKQSLTQARIKMFRQAHPQSLLTDEALNQAREFDQFVDMFTVSSLVNFICTKLNIK